MGLFISGDKERVGNKVLITGFLGGHEIAIISERCGSETEPKGKVLMRTGIGGTRIVDMLATEQIPRIY